MAHGPGRCRAVLLRVVLEPTRRVSAKMEIYNGWVGGSLLVAFACGAVPPLGALVEGLPISLVVLAASAICFY